MTGIFPSFLEIADHAAPGFRMVMGAVDAHAIHTVANQVAHQLIVRGRVRGHGDHDADLSAGRRGTQQGLGVGLQQLSPLADLDRGLMGPWQRAVGAQQGIQHAVYGLHRTEDVTLGTAERGKTEKSKLGLELTDIMPAQGKIVGKIPGAAAMRFMHRQRPLEKRLFQLEHIRAKQGQLRGELFEQRFIQDSHGGRTPVQDTEAIRILRPECYGQMKTGTARADSS